ncbi:ADA regulatory protein [Salmonella enterica subsp. enterica]|nr:ADA regulatory protein [Salmonella enterica subsp. enterica]
MKKALLTDDECWLRVQARDASADGRFVFAVRTTGVFAALLVARSGRYVKMFVFLPTRSRRWTPVFAPASAVSRIMRARSNGSWIRLPAPAVYLSRRRR